MLTVYRPVHTCYNIVFLREILLLGWLTRRLRGGHTFVSVVAHATNALCIAQLANAFLLILISLGENSGEERDGDKGLCRVGKSV